MYFFVILCFQFILQYRLCDRDWSNEHHVMCKNKQCCLVSSLQHHVIGERGITCTMFPGNMQLHRFLGLATVLSRSIHILCCCIVDDDTNLLHLFCDITKQILTVTAASCYRGMWHYVYHVPGEYAFASIFCSGNSIRQINTYSILLRHG